jgi:hypothetical protein
MNDAELLKEVKRFVVLQGQLITAWRSACPDSCDLEWVTDFPWRIEVTCMERIWMAKKHGAGVRFESGSLVVDVPHHVSETDWFESNRVYDYLESRNLLSIVDPSRGRERRALLFDAFERWATQGILVKREDEYGSAMYRLTQSA